MIGVTPGRHTEAFLGCVACRHRSPIFLCQEGHLLRRRAKLARKIKGFAERWATAPGGAVVIFHQCSIATKMCPEPAKKGIKKAAPPEEKFGERLQEWRGQTARPYGDSPPVDKLDLVASAPKKASDVYKKVRTMRRKPRTGTILPAEQI